MNAAEVEFPAGDNWAKLSGGIDCLPSGPVTKGNSRVVTVRLRNRGGVDRKVPADLHPGARLRLYHSPAGEAPSWKELTPKASARLAAHGAEKLLGPGEEFVALTVDLNDWFEVRQPGNYRLEVLFTSRDGGFADGRSGEVQFTLDAKGGAGR